MHIQKVIEQFGYRPQEVKIYLALLNLGDSTIAEIAKKSKLPRTTCYPILEKLSRDGLAYFFIKRRRRYWLAENPEKLLISLKEKEVALKMIIPELQALRHETGVKPTIRFYDGEDGMKLILNDILEEKRELRSLTSMEDAMILVGEYFKDFIENRYKNNLRVKFLTNRSPQTLALKKRDGKELRTTCFLPENFKLKNANFIYGNKVAVFSLNKKHPVGIIIEDKDVAETQAMLFDTIWEKGSLT